MFDSRKYHREYMQTYGTINRDRINARRRHLRTSPEGKAAALYERIKQKQKDTDITLEWLQDKILGTCELTGIAFDYVRVGNRAPKAPSVDRTDSNMGYYISNCQVILTWLNIAKQNMPDTYFKGLIKELQSNGQDGSNKPA